MTITERRRYPIGEAALALNLTTDTLTEWDKKGIVSAAERRGPQQRRCYSFTDLITVSVGLALRQFGVPLSRLPAVAAAIQDLGALEALEGSLFLIWDGETCRPGKTPATVGEAEAVLVIPLHLHVERLRQRIRSRTRPALSGPHYGRRMFP